jgi:hypothetical protein
MSTLIDALKNIRGIPATDHNAFRKVQEIAYEALNRPAPEAALDRSEDSERLDWLDGQLEAYGFENAHEGNHWTVGGAYMTLREAIDSARRVTCTESVKEIFPGTREALARLSIRKATAPADGENL